MEFWAWRAPRIPDGLRSTALAKWGLALCLALCLGWLCLIVGCSAEKKEDVQLMEQARQAYAAGHFFKAEQLFESYLQTSPQGKHRWDAWSRLLDIALMHDQWRQAASYLEAMHLEFGDSPARALELLKRLAEVYESRQQWDQSLEIYKKIQLLENIDPALLTKTHWKKAKLYLRKHEYDLSRQAAQECIALNPEPDMHGECLYVMAQADSYMHNWEQARQSLQEIMQMDGVSAERKAVGGLLLADIFERAGKIEEAADVLKSIRDDYPNPLVVDARLKFLQKK